MSVLLDHCRRAPVIPVLTIDTPDHAAPLAEALVAGGLPVLEVTLRTPAALAAISAMAQTVPTAVIGAGTLRSARDVEQAQAAGAQFGVSPGLSDTVVAAAAAVGLPLLPGVATPSEAMRAQDLGFEVLKFFPAEANGGVPVLKAWAAPLAGLLFCPTGGISARNAASYLAQDNVVCVGGSWVAPPDLVQAAAWAAITHLAQAAAAL